MNREDHFKAIYIAANEMLFFIGAHGHIEIDNEKTEDLMGAMKNFDGGQFDEVKMFGDES